MKTLFCLLLTFTLATIYSQEKINPKEETLIWIKKDCKKGTEDAKIDAKNGKYQYLNYGLIFEVNPELNEFVKEYREKKYGVNVGNGGCVISDYSECYSKTIEEIILEKFGADFFERSFEEAKALYLKQ